MISYLTYPHTQSQTAETVYQLTFVACSVSENKFAEMTFMYKLLYKFPCNMTLTFGTCFVAKLLRSDPPACLRENFAVPKKKSHAALA